MKSNALSCATAPHVGDQVLDLPDLNLESTRRVVWWASYTDWKYWQSATMSIQKYFTLLTEIKISHASKLSALLGCLIYLHSILPASPLLSTIPPFSLTECYNVLPLPLL